MRSSIESLSVGELAVFREGEEPALYRDPENGGERGEFPPGIDWNDITEFCWDMYRCLRGERGRGDPLYPGMLISSC